MRKALLTEEQVQAVFDRLNENGDAVGAARAMQIRAEYKVKKVHARLYRQAPAESIESKKAWVQMQDEYIQACEAHADAEGHWEKLKDERNKGELLFEAWRTIQANDRGFRRIG